MVEEEHSSEIPPINSSSNWPVKSSLIVSVPLVIHVSLHSYIRRHKTPTICIGIRETGLFISIPYRKDHIESSLLKMITSRSVCLIAGAGPGIGQAVAKRFAREGFTIVAVRRNKDQLQTLTADITSSGKTCP